MVTVTLWKEPSSVLSRGRAGGCSGESPAGTGPGSAFRRRRRVNYASESGFKRKLVHWLLQEGRGDGISAPVLEKRPLGSDSGTFCTSRLLLLLLYPDARDSRLESSVHSA